MFPSALAQCLLTKHSHLVEKDWYYLFSAAKFVTLKVCKWWIPNFLWESVKNCIKTTMSCPAIPRFSSVTELRIISVRMVFWLPYIEIESNSPSFPNVKFTFDIVIISWNCRSNLGSFGAILHFTSASLDFHHRHYDDLNEAIYLFSIYFFNLCGNAAHVKSHMLKYLKNSYKFNHCKT